MKPNLSIILPTYNEAETIVQTVRTIQKVCQKQSYEIIIVDDHSPDGTARLIGKNFSGNPVIRPLTNPGKRSLGLSILYGIKHSRGDIIVGMDADGNHDPALIPPLIKKLQDADLVVASRFLSGGGMKDIKKYINSFLYNKMLRIMLGFPLADNTSGYYAIRRHTLLSLRPSAMYYGYGEYHLRLVWRAFKKELTIVEIPVYYGDRGGGRSKSHALPMAYSYFMTALKLRFRL